MPDTLRWGERFRGPGRIKPMSNGTGDLQSRYEFNSAWADRIAFLIVAGLAIEIAAVFILHKPPLEGALTIVANLLIVLGVWGELIFARRAKEAGDGIVAQANAGAAVANARAEEAKLELARLTTPRSLTAEQQSELTERAKPFAGTPFDMFIKPDKEPLDLANQISVALTAAGWNWVPVNTLMGLNRVVKPTIGMTTATGVAVQMHETKKAEWEAAILAVANALHSAGIVTRAEEIEDESVTDAAVHIRIGAKP
jgi:hypothetical protein